ncbi:MAG TPA: FAD-dependent oxidoreductase [Longimicrobiales bacterium]|nr:FAD-dependent oxidoreductase [Longimicrobiales bacterium]
MAHPRKGVAILGGGVAGMSAAHELAQRGFQVTVFEAGSTPGGKARSIFVPNTGTEGRRDLPGEHGFRFFPSFYRHLPDTMKSIPYGRRTVFDNLVPATRTMVARKNARDVELLSHFPRSVEDLRDLLRLRLSDLSLSGDDLLFLAQRMWILLTSSRERRRTEYDRIPWWEFIDAERRSPEFRHAMSELGVRFLLAMNGRKASTKTVGDIGLQLWLDHLKPSSHVDRLLNGPTHDVWLGPWLAHLRQLGVDYRMQSKVESIRCRNERIVEVTIHGPEGRYTFADDYYIAALPVDRMRGLVTPEMLEGEPRLANLEQLQTDWMTGVQFFLDRDVQLNRGHLMISDCPWALTAVSQKQFWPDVDLSRFGDGRVDGILSVVISNWDAPGNLCGKPARECTREEIIAEIWEELKRHLNDEGRDHLEDSNLVYSYLADSVRRSGNDWVNDEPLLINTAGSWALRPEATTSIPNLFLAADYVRTNTDVASMESANEAARRAVNGILAASGVAAAKCRIWELEEPLIFEPLKFIDAQLFRNGLSHLFYKPGSARAQSLRPRPRVPVA